jgi:transposase
MRGRSDHGDALFSFVRLEERVPADHPLRAIRALTDEVLASLSVRLDALYARVGRPSIPPEMLLRATLLQAFFSICWFSRGTEPVFSPRSEPPLSMVF